MGANHTKAVLSIHNNTNLVLIPTAIPPSLPPFDGSTITSSRRISFTLPWDIVSGCAGCQKWDLLESKNLHYYNVQPANVKKSYVGRLELNWKIPTIGSPFISCKLNGQVKDDIKITVEKYGPDWDSIVCVEARELNFAIVLDSNYNALAYRSIEYPIPTSCDSTSLIVMAYNILQIPPSLMDWDQDNRLTHLGQAIRRLQPIPDVIVFTEVFSSSAVKCITNLCDLYPHQTPVVGSGSSERWNSSSGRKTVLSISGGVMIVSRFPVLERHQHVFQSAHESTFDYISNKGVAYVKMEKQGRIYNILGTHLQANEDGNNNEEHTTRVNQVKECKEWVDTFKIPSQQALILAGDLNVELNNPKELTEVLQTGDFVMPIWTSDGLNSLCGKSNAMTRAFKYWLEPNGDLDYGSTLDYVVYSNHHLHPTKSSVKVFNLKSQTSWYWKYLERVPGASPQHSDLSDHYPVIAQFEFEN